MKRLERLPIRVRMAGAFALAMIAVLVTAGALVYSQLRNDLNETIDENLRHRAATASAAIDQSAVDPDDEFIQLISRVENEGVLKSTKPGVASISVDEAREAETRTVVVERPVDGFEGTFRMVAVPTDEGVGVAGQSLEDRDETLSSVIAAFGLGGSVAVVLASLLGYALAAGSLRPVEAMRRRASQISLDRPDQRLPLPAARDEIHRLGSTLNAMLARLEASFERERQFVADASHELRTPIAAVKTDIEAALRGGDAGPLARESLVAASDEIDHLAQLADDLLLIARSTDGRLPVRPTHTEVRALLENARDRFADRAGARGRAIELAADGDLAADLDPVRMRQALGNLVDNALRYGDGTIELSAARDGDAVVIAVADEGDGFAPDLAPRAFERFVRGDRARTTAGSGLGLAIVRAIAEAHGGTASIDGAAVVMTLPA